MSDEELQRRVRALRVDGHSPKEIARALGLRPAAVAELVRTIARERAAAAPEPAVAGCWVSPGWCNGLTIAGPSDWPGASAHGVSGSGLASVLVALEHRHGNVSVCGYLVDVYCLGVKDALGPRVMEQRGLADLVRVYFGAYESAPLAAPLELARHLVLGAVDYARSLGFEPARDLEAARGHLGPWRGPSAIRFGRNGKPLFVQGARDNASRILRTLERSVGSGNFEFSVSVGVVPAGLAD